MHYVKSRLDYFYNKMFLYFMFRLFNEKITNKKPKKNYLHWTNQVDITKKKVKPKYPANFSKWKKNSNVTIGIALRIHWSYGVSNEAVDIKGFFFIKKSGFFIEVFFFGLTSQTKPYSIFKKNGDK